MLVTEYLRKLYCQLPEPTPSIGFSFMSSMVLSQILRRSSKELVDEMVEGLIAVLKDLYAKKENNPIKDTSVIKISFLFLFS
jgi:hypothetical protein